MLSPWSKGTRDKELVQDKSKLAVTITAIPTSADFKADQRPPTSSIHRSQTMKFKEINGACRYGVSRKLHLLFYEIKRYSTRNHNGERSTIRSEVVCKKTVLVD